MTEPLHHVPTLDISRLCEDPWAAPQADVDAVSRALHEIGFLSISGTGVDPELVTALRREIAALFNLPEPLKHGRAITRENYRGFIPFGFFTPNDGSGTPDQYEGYKLHFETAPDDPIVAECALYGPNIWPPEVPELKRLTLKYWAEMDRLSGVLLATIERIFGMTRGTLGDLFEKPMTNMSFMHYPPQAPNAEGFGIHAHKDTDALTIIAPDSVGGLEVQTPDGAWSLVSCPEGGFIVNIGDMLELWTGGRLVSTPHRVINRSGQERISFPYFSVPRHDVTVHPLLEPRPGFDRPNVHTGHWSAETWRTNWPDETATEDTPELGTIH